MNITFLGHYFYVIELFACFWKQFWFVLNFFFIKIGDFFQESSLTLYWNFSWALVTPARLPITTNADCGPIRLGPVRHMTRIDTLYSIGTHGIPPIDTRSLISSNDEPKLEPSIETRVPPSTGPEIG